MVALGSWVVLQHKQIKKNKRFGFRKLERSMVKTFESSEALLW